MKLNLGCGDRYVAGWHNVDYGTPCHVDERLDLRGELPWTNVTHAYAGHVLEHLSLDDCAQLLTRLRACMADTGGLLLVVGPDVQVAEKMIQDGTFDSTYHSLESLYDGAARWDGDEHQWGCTADLVAQLLRDAGWPVVDDLGGVAGLNGLAEGPSWPIADRTPQWQCAVRAWTGELTPW